MWSGVAGFQIHHSHWIWPTSGLVTINKIVQFAKHCCCSCYTNTINAECRFRGCRTVYTKIGSYLSYSQMKRKTSGGVLYSWQGHEISVCFCIVDLHYFYQSWLVLITCYCICWFYFVQCFLGLIKWSMYLFLLHPALFLYITLKSSSASYIYRTF